MLHSEGKDALIIPSEGSQRPATQEEKGTALYKQALERAQCEVGSIQWVALKTRPDVACATAIAASIQTRDPKEAIRLTEGIWGCLAKHRNMCMVIAPQSDAPVTVDISADASFAPGGERSRTGVAIAVAGTIVHWCSNKQSLSTVSTCESELSLAVTGVKLGMAIRQVVEQLANNKAELNYTVPMSLGQDNMACVQTITNEVTSWRTRHYALRAAWIRYMVKTEDIKVQYESGKTIRADGLTKVLPNL